MADNQHFEAIVGEAGRKLWSIFPEDAVEMRFEAQFHEWMETAGVSQWTRRDGSRGQYAGFGSRPEEVERSIKVDLANMRTLDIFQPRPWNHVTVVLNGNAKINFEYAHVDEIDQWPHLHLIGISGLDQVDATRDYGIPADDWRHVAGEVMKIRRGEAEEARASGDAVVLRVLERKIRDLQSRIEAAAT